MPDVFLSYSREDQATARRFAEALGREGFDVWWDQALHPGEVYDKATERALEAAKAVVVLWSRASVESRWVRSEATSGDRRGALVPVMIEPCRRPVQFELMQTAELSQWKGDPRDPAWQGLVAGIRRFVSGESGYGPASPAAVAAHAAPAGARAFATNRRRSFAIAALAVLLLGAALAWWGIDRNGWLGGEGGQAEGISLAVLPFANLSPDSQQEYFSDGLTEEILNQLAQVPGLRLIGRTSSFSFKGDNEDLRVIGRKLGVANLLEGSVRREGDELRITAQLIDARDGSHRWSKTYARELRDVFTVQEEIAREVAGALSVRLDVGELSRAKGGTTNVAAWEKYQQGRELLLQDRFYEAAPPLREAVAIDPGFALAWTALWEALRNLTVSRPPGEAAELRAEMAEAAARSIALVPDSWGAQWISAMQLREQLRWPDAEAAVAKLLQAPLTAENVEKAWGAVFFYSTVGRYRDLIRLMERMRDIEPLSLGIAGDITLGYLSDGRYDVLANAEYQRSKSLEGNHGNANWTATLRALADERADPEAVRAQLRVFLGEDQARWAPFHRELYARIHDRASAREYWRQAWAQAAPSAARWTARHFAQIGDALGDRDLALTILESDALQGDAQIAWWLPRSGVRSDPRFKEVLRRLGLVDYFRSSGNWGDYCRPVGEEDFECR